jgi:hypothetical protein
VAIVWLTGGVGLASALLRGGGTGATVVSVVAVLGFAGGVLLADERPQALRALLVAVALLAHLTAVETHRARTRRTVPGRQAGGAVAVAAATAALCALPALGVWWLLPAGVAGAVGAYALLPRV